MICFDRRALFLAMLTGPVFAGLSGAYAEGLQDLVNAARQEASDGTFFVSITQPNQESTSAALFQTFQKRFNISLRYEWQSHQTDYYTRVMAEAAAGRRTPDVMTGSPSNMLTLDGAGLLERFDWLKYAPELPGLEDAVTRPIEQLRGKSLAHFDVVYTMVYNTGLLAAGNVPTTLGQLTDAKWTRKLGIASSGAPLSTLVLALGREQIMDLARKLKANHPIFKGGAPGLVATVVTGEAPLAVGYTTGADLEKSKGAPVDWIPLKDYVPVLQQNIAVLKSAQKPNLARLFVAWMVSDEAMALQEKLEFMGRATARGTATWQRLHDMSPDAKIVEVQTLDDTKLVNDMQTELTNFFTQ